MPFPGTFPGTSGSSGTSGPSQEHSGSFRHPQVFRNIRCFWYFRYFWIHSGTFQVLPQAPPGTPSGFIRTSGFFRNIRFFRYIQGSSGTSGAPGTLGTSKASSGTLVLQVHQDLVVLQVPQVNFRYLQALRTSGSQVHQDSSGTSGAPGYLSGTSGFIRYKWFFRALQGSSGTSGWPTSGTSGSSVTIRI